MSRKLIPILAIVAAVAAAAAFYVRRGQQAHYYTGFVEGEERVVRSEVTGRVLEVKFAEGAAVPANAVIAALDGRDIEARLKSKQAELDMVEADIETQAERVTLIESTWKRDVSANRAALEQAQAAAELAERSFTREQGLLKTGASTAQLLDNARAERDQARGALDRARELLARSQAQQGKITVARRQLESLRQKRDLARAELGELQVTESKYTIHAPAVATVVQTQYIWPGELAQPGSAVLSVLDPKDKYVQIYVPVADVGRLRLGQRVAIELDSRPGHRVPGEVSFLADKANFTPEKIETRSDRMGQV
ncbi:MAG: HlyD family secretion protein, partial [Acidobacteriota bacterium]